MRTRQTKDAIIYRSRKISYQVYDQFINTAIARLKSLGIKKGDRVAICSPNSVEYLILLPALWRIGAISCPMSTRIPRPALLKQLKKINCRTLVSPKKIVSLTATPLTPKSSPIPHNQKVTILFTSGSTSDPKAVVHTYGQHYYNAKGSNENIAVRPGDGWLLSLPLYHVSGLGIFFRVIVGGGAVVVPEEKENLISAIKNNPVTHVSLVTTQLHRLMRDPQNIPILRKLKAILLGGSAIPPELIKAALKHKLPIYVTYGLTETASQVATSAKPGSAAKILKYRHVKIADDGEILVKGKTLFSGYAQGEKIIRPFKNGWFATGDVGKLEKGCLTVTGRKDNMFVSGGENIYPEEIEKELLGLPSVTQAIVVPQTDPEFGQRPVAFIKGKAQLSKIVSTLERNLPHFKIPRKFYPWPAEVSFHSKVRRQTFVDFLKKK